MLVAGDNFGCGSSREHAPWALMQFGFRAVVSTSFADIFKRNRSEERTVADCGSGRCSQHVLIASPGSIVKIDLRAQTLTLAGWKLGGISHRRVCETCLLEGVDELGYILQQERHRGV